MKSYLQNTLLIIALTYCWSQESLGQEESSSSSGLFLAASYAYQIPSGDLSDRFGNNFALSGEIDWLLRGKWILGAEAKLLFGNEVKESVLGGIVTDYNDVININVQVASFDIRERGGIYLIHLHRLLDLWGQRSISGLRFGLGAGYMRHKIRIGETANAVPHLQEPYIRGYDRLTSGPAIAQFLGIQHLEHSGLLNLFIGVEAIEGFTSDRRKVNYDRSIVNDKSRLDILVGLKAGIQITLSAIKNPEEISY